MSTPVGTAVLATAAASLALLALLLGLAAVLAGVRRHRRSRAEAALARAHALAAPPADVPAVLTELTAAAPLPPGALAAVALDLGIAALPGLREAVRSAGPAEQASAAELLGVHGDAVATAVLGSAATDTGRPLPVRRAAVAALGRIGSSRGVDPLTAVLLSRADPALRAAAATALGRTGDAAALPALTAGLADADGDLRAACAAALAALGPEGREVLSDLASGAGPAGDAARAASGGCTRTASRTYLVNQTNHS